MKDSNELYQIRKLNKENKELESQLNFKVKIGIAENAGIEYPDGKKLRLDRCAGKPKIIEEDIKEFNYELYKKYCTQFDTTRFLSENPELKSEYSVSTPYTKLVFPRD